MRRSSFTVVALATSLPLSLILPGTVGAQSTVAPPSAVQSAPLAAPPVAATPAQTAPGAPQPAQVTPPAPLPAEPQPVQPPPAPPGPVVPQPVQPAPQAPAEPQPVQPPPSLPAPQPLPAPPVQPTPPAQQQTGQSNPDATLAGKKGDPSDVDEIALPVRNVLILAGQSSWDQGFQGLAQSIAKLRAEAARLGLPVAGRPLSLFVQTDDNGFRFEAMLPVARPPEAGATLGNGIRAGQSPAGKALRFVHVAPYDDIDSTYETITAYLEAKGIVVQDAFLEEYVGDLTDSGDPNLEINVYVQPK